MFLVVGRGLEESDSPERKIELDQMAAMLSRLGKRGYSLQEESPACRIDFDSDSDFDQDSSSQRRVVATARSSAEFDHGRHRRLPLMALCWVSWQHSIR